MELPQIPFISLEIKASPNAITDVSIALPICWSLSPCADSTEPELTLGNLFLPKKVELILGRWESALGVGVAPVFSADHGHTFKSSAHSSTLTFLGCFLFFATLHLCLRLILQLSCCYLMSPTSHRRWDCCCHPLLGILTGSCDAPQGFFLLPSKAAGLVCCFLIYLHLCSSAPCWSTANTPCTGQVFCPVKHIVLDQPQQCPDRSPSKN